MSRQQTLRLAMSRRYQPGPFLGQLVASLIPTCRPTDGKLLERVSGALRAGQYERAISLTENWTNAEHSSLEDFFLSSQVASLVRKAPFKDPLLQPEAVAWKKFLASEHSCKRINQRLRAEKSVARERYASMRGVARAFIRKVLGDEPNLKRILERCDFGPGASIGVSGSDTNLAAKLDSDSWTVTPTCAPYAFCSLTDDFHVRENFAPVKDGMQCFDQEAIASKIKSKFEMVGHNKIIMVPKTARVHRTIAIEPLLNGYVQKGVDLFMRDRLLAHGIDLTDQTRNQRLAKEGSFEKFNTYSTIDLSAASDTISIETVRDLLPAEWFNFLNRVRSPTYESEWGCGRYEKFTSMGNGFCFPLETLIFASLCVAANDVTGETDYSVYGDDIIVRQSTALLLIELLQFYGFRTNVDKTFIFGPFRESCGADYISGVNVRPYILDDLPLTRRDVMKIHNGLLVNERFIPLVKPMLDFLYREVQDLPHKPIGHTDAQDDAVAVPLDAYMAHWSSRWCPHEQRWLIYRMLDRPVSRPGQVSSAICMYGLLRGAPAKEYLPNFTLRRKTVPSVKLS